MNRSLVSSEEAMHYALLIYGAPGAAAAVAEVPDRAADGVIDSWVDYTRVLKDAGVLAGAEQLPETDTASSVRVRSGARVAAERRPVRRDQGAPARLLPRRRPRPGRGRRVGGTDAGRPLRHRRGAACGPGRGVAGSAGVSAPPPLERAFRDEWAQVVATL